MSGWNNVSVEVHLGQPDIHAQYHQRREVGRMSLTDETNTANTQTTGTERSTLSWWRPQDASGALTQEMIERASDMQLQHIWDDRYQAFNNIQRFEWMRWAQAEPTPFYDPRLNVPEGL